MRSSAESGSSISKSSGCDSSARPIATRWRSPPESRAAGRSKSGAMPRRSTTSSKAMRSGFFVRRITLRAFFGAVGGSLLAAAILATFPATGAAGLPALRPDGFGWALLVPVPLFAALVAWITTRRSALRMLKGRP